ncbi:hypothetical protein [Sinorhizobium meliloti]|uniref:hypothetical protein n=1 Tax=Rhizobium meliloti TaxID=382 RepID=UPI000FD713EF|nr:hypothetical protein [Sinorhizobium meliloti]RVH21434.1 hypothetical protein CN216_00230 [Sinorhizobium meliloti]RVH21495.1 hypothetical protein CN216_00550 [Sinorhizobium meliloti]
MLEIVRVPPTVVEIAEGVKIDMPALAYIGIDDGEVVGSYGLAWGRGRCWIWLKLANGKPSYARTVIKRAKALLAKARQLGEREVFTPRDTEYPTSKKLLTVLGFRMHAIEHGIEVWRYEWI